MVCASRCFFGGLGGLGILGILGALGIPNHIYLIVSDAFTKRSD